MSIKNTAADYKDLVRPLIKDPAIISYLDSEGDDMFAHFINFSNKLDELRDEYIVNGNPLLSNYIANYQHTVTDSSEFLLATINAIKN
jgi:hypothetical protein